MKVSDYNSNAAAVPQSLFFRDGLDEILAAPGETEGLDLGFLGNVLDPLGIFKTGGPPAPNGQPQSGGGLGGLIPNPMGLLGNITQGIGQALGMGGASNPLGSLLGAGLGGTIPGTGPLPGALGQASQNLFGQPGLPPAAIGAQAGLDYQQLANHTEKTGRAVVRRVLGGLTPYMNQIRQQLAYRRNQIQATAEHNQLNAADAYQRQMLGMITGLVGRRAGTWAV